MQDLTQKTEFSLTIELTLQKAHLSKNLALLCELPFHPREGKTVLASSPPPQAALS